MRRLFLSLLLLTACKSPPTDERERTAASADLTTRQLIAALNANSAEALAKLVVITSTSSGPPRSLRADEVSRLVFSDPPFEYLGAGKPGTMLLRDGAKQKRSVRLVEVGNEMRVLGTVERFSAYAARESGSGAPSIPGVDSRVVSIMRIEP